MKNCFIKSLTILGLVLTASSVNAQYVSNDNEAGVYLLSKNAPQYVEGEVIVKFTDSEKLSVKRNAQGRFLSASASAVNAQLQELGTYAMEQLMPLSGAKRDLGARRAVSSNRMISDVDLSQLYVVKYSKEDISVFDVIERLKTLDNVEFAEPNSIAYICGTEADETSYTDPLYSQQWGIPAINLPALWSLPKTDQRRPIIAILDTGVEITHPDLVDNIWTNQAELTGSEFVDDDNNGYCDDLHGWDFVSNTAIINDGMDKNGHGTHCAGIAAACGNNGVGIVGANPDAIILPIKVIGDDGSGTMTSIIRGVDYAIAAKADLLSMSFGTHALYSQTLRTALEKAYARYIISVGAAGNYSLSIN